MLDPIIISYKLTTNVSVTFYRIQQYPVDNTYNINLKNLKDLTSRLVRESQDGTMIYRCMVDNIIFKGKVKL